jgi:rhodanese-related sulfurtransferase
VSHSASSRQAPVTVEQMLDAARRWLERLTPHEAQAMMREGALLIDIRSETQRARDGAIPGARFVPRNVLEWRMDPACPHRDPSLARPDAHIVLVCDGGGTSRASPRPRCRRWACGGRPT